MTRNLRKSPVLAALHRKKDPLQSERVRTSMMLAARISLALKSKGWNRLQLAEALGKQPSIITRWLSGTHNFTSDTLSDIQTVLGVQLLIRSDEELKISVTRYSLSISVAQLPHLDRENLRSIAENAANTGGHCINSYSTSIPSEYP
jgi:ribosome-binding protein aMBF1 (putative translation factor)